MIKGTTKTGFEYTIEDYRLDNAELVDTLIDLDEGDNLAPIKACTMLLGKEQKKKLYDHCRGENGTVPMAKFAEEVINILQELNDGKKS